MKKTIAYVTFAMAAAFALTACEDIRVEKYPDGKVLKESIYVNDKKQGIEKEYYNSGALRRETNYNEDRREGVSKEYFEDGNLQSETPYSDGYIEGEVVRYYQNGKIASKAKYKQNKQIEIGESYKEDGAPTPSGDYKDPRDDYEYKWVRIGTQLWIAENINFATPEGSMCIQCSNWGRLYNFESAKTACLDGFHMPSKDEWETLLQFAAEKGKVASVLKANFGWDPITEGSNDFGNGTNMLGFAAKAGGGHFAKSDVPRKDRKFDGAGKKAYFWTTDGDVLVFYHNKDVAKFEKFNPEFGASLRCLKD